MRLTITIICFLLFVSAFSQEALKTEKIVESYKEYITQPREIVYAHLNKSTYIKGEDVGFTAYVLNKFDKKLSSITTNLYCAIIDKEENVLKEKLLKVDNGIVSNQFSLDSLFTSGEYKFVAYTNWMKNFDEQNFFMSSIKVIDPDVETSIKNKVINAKIDAQFLPEGGHLISDVENVIGVVLKDSLGFGLSYIEGELQEEEGKQVITKFKVNKLGIGKFSFTPSIDEKYSVVFKYNNETVNHSLSKSELRGIAMSLSQEKENLLITFKTNKRTLPAIVNKKYSLVIHNGSGMKKIAFSFDQKEIIKNVSLKNLFSGINIFTLFDENNNPLLERIFFNYTGMQFVKSKSVSIQKRKDSLSFKLLYEGVNFSNFNNISISVLPEGTASYKHHHNLVSYTFLKPYLKSTVENGKYYFTDIDKKKKKALDNLMITQGWSSYDWNAIFDFNPKIKNLFETGIIAKVNTNNKEISNYVVHPVHGGRPNYYLLSEADKTFVALDLFPFEEKITISKMTNKDGLKPAMAHVQFYPSNIPKFDFKYQNLNLKNKYYIKSEAKSSFSNLLSDKVQKLDVVNIKGEKAEEVRIERIKRKSYGKVDVFTDVDRNMNQTFADYIRTKGYKVNDAYGKLTIQRSSSATSILLASIPTIYLDGVQIIGYDNGGDGAPDFSRLHGLDMSMIDYIDINKSGIGEGIRGGAGGVIRIVTDPKKQLVAQRKVKTFKQYEFPLTFSHSKKYYVPKYQDYSNRFFEEYGTIDWLPINKIKENGECSFKIRDTKNTSIILFIEGMLDDGSFILETKQIVLR